jgi:hypothetical protein
MAKQNLPDADCQRHLAAKTIFLQTPICGLSSGMTHPHPHPLASAASNASHTPLRSHADYRWTPDKAMAFLEALATCGKIAEAARGVGMTRQSAYRLRTRSALVAQAWPLALAAGRERRGVRGQGDTSGTAR